MIENQITAGKDESYKKFFKKGDFIHCPQAYMELIIN